MSVKKEYTLEELEAQYKLADEHRNTLKQQIEQKKKAEKELRDAHLALEHDKRKKEVDDALEKYKKLLRAYMRDYGSYSYNTNDNIFSFKFLNDIF